jgi:Trk K+ transport system NAD-binding subunit
MPPSHRISNEFAIVTVAVVESPRGTVLEIRSEESGRAIRLDALELEALAGVGHRDLDVFVLRTTQAAVDLQTTEGERSVADGSGEES